VRFCRQVSPQPPRAQRSFRISRLVVATPLPFFFASCLSVDCMADREVEVAAPTSKSRMERRTCQVFTLGDCPTLFLLLHVRVSDVADVNRMPYFSYGLFVPSTDLILNRVEDFGKVCNYYNRVVHPMVADEGDIHIRQDSSERVITLLHRPLPTQHTTNTKDEHSLLHQVSNPQSQHSSGRRRTLETARPPISAQ
jgi:hypothetical protein